MATKKHKLYLNIKDLMKRGWTNSGISQLFKEPDKYAPKTKEKLFLRRRVEKVERIHGVQ